MERGKKIIIFGAGSIARAAILYYKSKECNIIGCAVTNASGNVKRVLDIDVYDADELLDSNPDIQVVVAVRDCYYSDVEKYLERKKNSRIRFSVEETMSSLEKEWEARCSSEVWDLNYVKKSLTKEEYLLFLSKQLKGDQLSFEVNIADHCNLNCQSCNHFSSIADSNFLDIDSYKKDLMRIRELFGSSIGRIMLLGGEPLLNKSIEEIMDITRRIMPTESIYICTNGILFPDMPQSFWHTCSKHNIGIKVTQYPIKFDYDYWFQFAEKNNVEMMDENPEPVKTTYRLLFRETGGFDSLHNYSKCYHANQCIVLREGYLCTCPMAAWSDILNKRFNTNFPEFESSSINIYEAQNAKEILEFLMKPNKMCEYCNIDGYVYDIPWRTSTKKEEEWIER